MAAKEPADTSSNNSTNAKDEYKNELADQEEQWKSCLDAIKQAVSEDEMLALHCGGDNLSRSVEMQFLSIATRGNAYFFDMQKLKMLPFEHGLREILEDKKVMKLTFDCREDADALFHQFHVKLDGVLDIQLLEIMKRPKFQRNTINRKRGDHTIDAIGLKSISDCMIEKSDKLAKRRKKRVREKGKRANRPLTSTGNQTKYGKYNVLSLFRLFDHYKPVAEEMKRLTIASQIYVDLKRSIPSREYNDFENHRYLPVDVIPDKGTITFQVGNISCKTCHRRFPRAEFSNYQLKTNNQMCRTCKKVKNDNDVYQNRLNQWGEYCIALYGSTNDIDDFDYFDHIDDLTDEFYFFYDSPW